MFCSKCGSEMAGGAKFCSKCGTVMDSAYLCPDCGKEIALDDVFCPFCGYKIIKSEDEINQEKKKTVETNYRYVSNQFDVIKKYDMGDQKFLLLKAKDAFESGKDALIWIDDLERIVISDESGLFKQDKFIETNCVKNRYASILERRVDRVITSSMKHSVFCCFGNEISKYVFVKDKNNRINVKKKGTCPLKIYDLNEGSRYVLDGIDLKDKNGKPIPNCIALVDENGELIWAKKKKSDSDSDSVFDSLFSKTEDFPAPFFMYDDHLINMLTGKTAIKGIEANGSVKAYKDRYTAKKIIEVSDGGFVNVSYKFYEIGFDFIKPLENMDEAESLSNSPERYVEYNDKLSKYRINL